MKRLGLSWRAGGLVAAVFGYFLIFAQFAWVEILRGRGMPDGAVQGMLAAMALGGIAGGVLAAWRVLARRPWEFRAVLAGTGLLTAAGALAPGGAMAAAVSFGCGLGIGAATVATASGLGGWLGRAGGCWAGGIGTGIGYAMCNVPWLFGAPPVTQALAGSVFLIVAAAALVPGPGGEVREIAGVRRGGESDGLGMVAALFAFTAMVWLDSAAFFVIQHNPEMKAGSWGGEMLWRNAALHLAGGVAAGWWLGRDGPRRLLGLAFVLLAGAAMLVQGGGTRVLGGWIYPVAVSLYSTAFVCWPGVLDAGRGGDVWRRGAWRAAVLFAVAGWIGSANGIGMVTRLQRIPVEFAIAAGLAVGMAVSRGWPGRMRVAAVAGVVMLAVAVEARRGNPDDTPVERGRAVYVAEGCIHCHSRYVRPDSPDLDAWGPAAEPEMTLAEHPVLIGNRRQGPDLLRVGGRRSAAWLKLKLEDPRRFAPDSPMPRYAHLLADRRADDLVAYLLDGAGDAVAWRLGRAAEWRPGTGESGPAPVDARRLFARHCAVCHGGRGQGDGPVADRLSKRPADLAAGPFVWSYPGADLEVRIARLVKFGVPGGEMPGHEMLDDAKILSLARLLAEMRKKDDE